MLAVFFIDLDNFKKINDSLGHDTGDQVLIEVGKRLIASLRKEDTIARLGGDEFVAALEIKGQSDAVDMANKIINSINQPIFANNNTIQISSSIGIVIYPEHGNELKDLLSKADIALLQAKHEGKDRFKIYSGAGME
jgi:diguanylate cyclase (GGDEF)-like protein